MIRPLTAPSRDAVVVEGVVVEEVVAVGDGGVGAAVDEGGGTGLVRGDVGRAAGLVDRGIVGGDVGLVERGAVAGEVVVDGPTQTAR